MNEEPHNLTENERVTESLRPDPVVAEPGSGALEGGSSTGTAEPSTQATIESTATDDSIDSSQENAPQAGDVAESDSAGVESKPRPVAAVPTDSSPSEADPASEDAVSEDAVSEDAVSEDGVSEDGVTEETEEPVTMDWYILKVQSNRERSIAEALQRKIAIEGLDQYFGQVIVPTEKVTEFKGGKKKIVERKLWPGYIVVNMHINDDTWFAVRETSGIGDFTGAAGKPTPMQPHEVARVVQTEEADTEETPKLAIKFKEGDKVKVKEGNFESFEGEVGTIDGASGRVTVMINIFGRSTPVELEYWQIESA
jgi:transcriptional antiterminator NusG